MSVLATATSKLAVKGRLANPPRIAHERDKNASDVSREPRSRMPHGVRSGCSSRTGRQPIAILAFRVRSATPSAAGIRDSLRSRRKAGIRIWRALRASRCSTFPPKILKSANPGDLPIEQPADVKLVLNVRTARAIGFTIPRPLLLRVDRLIQ
jgi:hypothetical protein